MAQQIRTIQPVIMSGGAGTRLWPFSRAARPKQFLPLASDITLFQETARRVAGEGFLPPLVIGGAAHAALIVEQLGAVGIAPAGVVLEPAPRNTAAVAAVAAAWTRDNAPGALTLLTPADHHVAADDIFRRLVAEAAPVAAGGRIVTLGIRPNEPHTGFGYIERGEGLGGSVFAIAGFREKPDPETATRYLEGGRHFWNAGVFLFAPETMLEELGRHAPAIRDGALAALGAATRDGVVIALDSAAFEACPAESVDYAVMEKTAHAAVAGPADMGWSDIGAWSALEGSGPASEADNICVIDSEGCVIRTDGPFVGVLGVEDLVIVATGDAVLVAPKARAQEVKKIVETLRRRGKTHLL